MGDSAEQKRRRRAKYGKNGTCRNCGKRERVGDEYHCAFCKERRAAYAKQRIQGPDRLWDVHQVRD